MLKFWSICRNTFVETIREPVYGILILVAFGVLVLTLPLSHWTMGGGKADYQATDQKMLASMGLATLLVSGLLIATFSASSAISREINNSTVQTVITKPISRAVFVLGKFAGVAGAVTVAFYLSALVFLMTYRHQVMSTGSDKPDLPVIVLGGAAFVLSILAAFAGNYLFAWPFTSAAVRAGGVLLTAAMVVIAFVGKEWTIVPFGQDIDPQLFTAMALLFLAVLILTAVAVAASTRVGQLATLLICVGFFFVGTTHPYLFRDWAETTPVADGLRWVAPNLTFFYPLDAVVMEKTIPGRYVLTAAAYAGFYIAALLAIGAGLFQRRQLEAQDTTATVPGAVALLAWTGRLIAIGGGIVGLALLTIPAYQTVRGIVAAAVILVSAGALWMLTHRFGQGARWSWWVMSILSGLVLAAAITVLVVPPLKILEERLGPVRLVLAAGVSAVVLALIMLRKSRRHFSSQRRG